MVGFIAKTHQSVFINRKNKADREGAFAMIENRADMAQRDEMGPIFIFPEGTTGNGRGLLKFK